MSDGLCAHAALHDVQEQPQRRLRGALRQQDRAGAAAVVPVLGPREPDPEPGGNEEVITRCSRCRPTARRSQKARERGAVPLAPDADSAPLRQSLAQYDEVQPSR